MNAFRTVHSDWEVIPGYGDCFSVSVECASIAARYWNGIKGSALSFSLPGCSFEEPRWSDGTLLLGGLHWDMSRGDFVCVSTGCSFAGITPHHFRVKCDVSGLYSVFFSGCRGKSFLITASTRPLQKKNQMFFTGQPIPSGRMLCSYQARYRL